MQQGEILQQIYSPDDLKKLNEEQLIQLCAELRKFIIDVISENPGHLGASLGTVELTVALHYVFNTPYDKLVWDVGHQAYGHKILTGRKDVFHTNRKFGGISGFPKMTESPFDAFGTGHSSTSISAILGMAIAARNRGDLQRQHIAVIGDGSMTAGEAFEAVNHAGHTGANILVVVNDNGIAIDANVGALKEYLIDITTSKAYNRLKNLIWRMMGGGTRYGANSRAIVQQIQAAIKGSILKKSNYFESLGFRYFGPVDGHDVKRLVKLLTDLKQIPGPKLLHVITTKGKGLSLAEKNQTEYHAPGKFDKETGAILKEACETHTPKYQTVFGRTLIELAENNPLIVGVTPAMATGCSMNLMMEKMPDRVFDVGIAEQHAVTFSAGLAADGYIPFCNIYSSFLQRAYDQVIHDVALQHLPVVFCLDRGGLVGEDGPTHHGVFDMAFLRPIPGLVISAPLNEIELRNLMFTASTGKYGPFVIRYPRGRGVIHHWKQPMEEIPVGKAAYLVEGEDLAIIAIGHPGNFALKATQILQQNHNIRPTVVNMRFLKPLDQELLTSVLTKHHKIVTVEDGVTKGGLGSAIADFIAGQSFQCDVKCLGVPDDFIPHGTPEELYALCGFDVNGIVKAALEIMRRGDK